MRGNKIIGFIWIIIAIFLIYILVVKVTTGKKIFNNKNLSFRINSNSIGEAVLYDTQIFSSDKFDSFDISLSSESLHIEQSNTDDVIVELYGNEDTVPTVEVEGNVLSIESPKNMKHVISLGGRKVIVKLPKGYIADSVDLDLASGSTHISNCNFRNLESKNSSGSVHIENCDVEKMELVSHSGSVHIENSKIPEAEISSSSGSVRVDGSFDTLNVRAVSGSVRADLKKSLNQDSEIYTTSGSINLSVPNNMNAKIKYSVTSGNYRNSISGTSGKTGTDHIGIGGPTLKLSSTSGSINVN